jgi:hypothetical protein
MQKEHKVAKVARRRQGISLGFIHYGGKKKEPTDWFPFRSVYNFYNSMSSKDDADLSKMTPKDHFKIELISPFHSSLNESF